MRVAKSRTRLSDFTFTFHFHALKKEMATHCCNLAWEIPWTEEPGRLQSTGHKELDTTEQLSTQYTQITFVFEAHLEIKCAKSTYIVVVV